MLPEAEVSTFIENDETLRTKPMGQFYQHAIRSIKEDFKYKSLTLWQLGVPDQDVLHIKTQGGEYYVELVQKKI
jgi:hypothetical protein